MKGEGKEDAGFMLYGTYLAQWTLLKGVTQSPRAMRDILLGDAGQR